MGFTRAFTDRLAEHPDLHAAELQGRSCPCVVGLSSPSNRQAVSHGEKASHSTNPG